VSEGQMNYHADTIVIAVVGIIILWRIFSCKHYWELIDKTEIESRLETIMKTAKSFSYSFASDVTGAAYKRVVLALRCTKCGRARIHKIDSA
jgi:hypothetical protein